MKYLFHFNTTQHNDIHRYQEGINIISADLNEKIILIFVSQIMLQNSMFLSISPLIT